MNAMVTTPHILLSTHRRSQRAKDGGEKNEDEEDATQTSCMVRHCAPNSTMPRQMNLVGVQSVCVR